MAPPHRWPAAALAGLVAGIALCPLPDVRLLALALTLLALVALALRPPWRPLLLLLALVTPLGYLRTDLEYRLLARDPLMGLDRACLEVWGTVLESPRPRSWGSACRFRLERVDMLPRSGQGDRGQVPGRLEGTEVLVEWRGDLSPGPGQRWRLLGRLAALPGPRYPRGFDAEAWLGRQGIHHRLRVEQARFLGQATGWLPVPLAWRLRGWLVGNLEAGLPPRAGALVQGLALGESRALPAELQEAFRRSGTSHLLAASGLNVAIVTGLVFWIARRLGFGRRPAALPALAGAAFYALLAGCSPSVTRAAVMAAVALLALMVGRPSSVWHALQLAGLAILAVRPLWLLDVGFQLSLAAVAGLAAWAAPLERRLLAWPRPLRLSVAASLAATLATSPVLAWHFQEVSVVAVLANLLMVPVAEAMLPLGLGGALLAGLWEPLARVPFLMCTLGTEFLCAAAQVLGEVVEPVRVPRPDGFGLGACLLAFLWLRLELAREFSPLGRALLALLAVALSCQALAPRNSPPGDLTLRLADLSGGVMAWVTTPAGTDLLLVESEKDRAQAEEVLALHGRRAADGLYVLSSGLERVDSPEAGVRIEVGRGTWRLSWRQFAFLWAAEQAAVPRLPHAGVALLPRSWSPEEAASRVQPCLTVWAGGPPRVAWRSGTAAWWSTDRHGPLEVRTDGRVVRWQRWRG